jgi:hypothetical protein
LTQILIFFFCSQAAASPARATAMGRWAATDKPTVFIFMFYSASDCIEIETQKILRKRGMGILPMSGKAIITGETPVPHQAQIKCFLLDL